LLNAFELSAGGVEVISYPKGPGGGGNGADGGGCGGRTRSYVAIVNNR
jgi:hypothetical protein